MLKSERLKIYEWCEANQKKNGATYPMKVHCTQCDYEAIRQAFYKRYKYAGIQLMESHRDVKTIQVFIK